MRISWIISESIPDNLTDSAGMKDIAETWGSWKTWKSYRPDNCICSTTSDAMDLIGRAFHAVCTLYIMEESYLKVGSPVGVKLFNGHFENSTVSNKDDIIALNLAVPKSDIVLMYGFDFSPVLTTDDKDTQVAREEYYFNVREIIKAHPTTQFVMVDYMHELASWAHGLENVTFDTISSVNSLLG